MFYEEEAELLEVSTTRRRCLKKWLDSLADVFKRLAGKAIEALPAIVGSVAGASLSFLGKAIGFVTEHTWAFIKQTSTKHPPPS